MKPAVAVIAQREILEAERGGVRRVKRWTITWRGPCGSFAADTTYTSADNAEAMAHDCGAEKIERA